MSSRKLKSRSVRQARWWAAAALIVGLHAPAMALDCPPDGYTREQLLDIKANNFEIADQQQRNALAIELLACVADPDPLIRDGVVYEGFSTWLRGPALEPETVAVLYQNLLEQVSDSSDPGGFQQPFAALLLSEVARTDRVEPAFTANERAELVQAAARYLSEVSDYRGFSETQGWRHGVAHASDWVLQLVLNDNITAEQVAILMAAVARQVAPAGEVFYIYGEPGRLARAVFYAHRRGLLSEAEWQSWLAGIGNPSPLAGWNQSYASQIGLAKRHNTLEFLNALFVYAQAAEDDSGEQLAAQVLVVIKQMM